MTTGLLLVLVLGAGSGPDGFPIGDLGNPGLHIDFRLASDLLQDDVQMQLPHSGDHRLLGFSVVVQLEGHILFGRTLQELVELVLVLLGRCIDGHGVDGLGQLQRQVGQIQVGPAEGVVGGGAVHLGENPEISRGDAVRLIELFPEAGVHLGDLLLLFFPGIHQLGVTAHRSGDHLDVGELSAELLDAGLEHEAGR